MQRLVRIQRSPTPLLLAGSIAVGALLSILLLSVGAGGAQESASTVELREESDRKTAEVCISEGLPVPYYAREIPGLFFFLGARPKGVPPEKAAPYHSPCFFAHEGARSVGVRAISHLVVDYMTPGEVAS